MKFQARAFIAIGFILGFSVCLAFAVDAQPAKGIPGYPFLSWGMSLEDVQKAFKGKPGYFRFPEPMDYEGDLWICASDGSSVTVGQYKVSRSNFIFEKSGEKFALVMYSGEHNMASFTETSQILNYFKTKYPTLPHKREENESIHFAWNAGKSEIHVVQPVQYLNAGGSQANIVLFRVKRAAKP